MFGLQNCAVIISQSHTGQRLHERICGLAYSTGKSTSGLQPACTYNEFFPHSRAILFAAIFLAGAGVLGGVIIYDRAILKNRTCGDMLTELSRM